MRKERMCAVVKVDDQVIAVFFNAVDPLSGPDIARRLRHKMKHGAGGDIRFATCAGQQPGSDDKKTVGNPHDWAE